MCLPDVTTRVALCADWEETCIRNYGHPLTACSYFVGKEYPKYMTVFYISYFLTGIISIGCLLITIGQLLKYLNKCRKKHGKNMLLPSKVEYIPECTQACAAAPTQPA